MLRTRAFRPGSVLLALVMVASILVVTPGVASADGHVDSVDVTNRDLDGIDLPEPEPLQDLLENPVGSLRDIVDQRFKPLPKRDVVVEVRGDGGRARFDDLPMSVVVPNEDGRTKTDVRVVTADETLAGVLSPVGVAFSLTVATEGGPSLPSPSESYTAGLGQSASRGVAEDEPADVPSADADRGADGGEVLIDEKTGLRLEMTPGAGEGSAVEAVSLEEDDDPSKVVEPDETPSGWKVEIDTAALGVGPVDLAEIASRLTVVYWSGCDEFGACAAQRRLPAEFDSESRILTATLPRQVLADLARVSVGDGGGLISEAITGSSLANSDSGGMITVGTAVNGQSGNFGASAYASQAAWQVGTFTGSAEASYQFDLPPAVGLVPELGLSYSSGSVDGLSTSINTQPGPVGLGWDLSRATISRATRPCTSPNEGNLCLIDGDENDAFSLSLNGVGGRLSKKNVPMNDPEFGTYQGYSLEMDPSLRIRKFTHETSNRKAVAVESTPSGEGYWTIDKFGTVQAFGDAVHYGNATGGVSNIVDIARTSNGAGYWLVGSDGGVFAYGNAGFFGSLPGYQPPIVVSDIVGIAPRSDNLGYWLARADGAIYAFSAEYYGNATPFLSAGDSIIDIAGNATSGYWMLSVDGGVFSFGSAGFYGASTRSDLRGIEPTGTGNGYWLVNHWGNVTAFGDAQLSDISELKVSYTTVDIARAGSTSGVFVAETYGRVSPLDGATWTVASHFDVNGTWWQVTTTAGVDYYFGTGFEPNSNLATNSVRYSPLVDETMAAGLTCGWDLCDYALGWDLDRIVDSSGNAATLFYEPEVNWFASKVANGVFKNHGYMRSNVLTRIEYGFEAGTENNKAPYQVSLGYSARCLMNTAGTACQQQNSVDFFPDTPVDLSCLGFGSCSQNSPSFWTYFRLATVVTGVLNAAGNGHNLVKSWNLKHTFNDPDPGVTPDESVRKLWLNDINAQSADPGKPAALPAVVYSPVMLDNRVSSPTGVSPMTMPRLGSILNEFGGLTTFSYGQSHPWGSSSECDANSDNNIRPPCDAFVAWDSFTSPNDFAWFNKWKVLSVTADPRFGGTPMTTSYTYVGAPNWRYAERFGLTETDTANCYNSADQSTCNRWTDFRGHDEVRVNSGDGTETTYYFYTGMNGDRWAGDDTSPKPATVKDSDGTTNHTDEKYLVGRVLDVVTRDVATGNKLSRSLSQYNITTPVGTGWPFRRLISTKDTTSWVFEDNGTALKTKQSFTVDAYGNVTQIRDLGAEPATGDEYTTDFTYLNDTGNHIVSAPLSTQYYKATSTPPAGILSRSEWTYEPGTAAVKRARTATAISPTTGPTAWSTTNYEIEDRGRVKSMTDASGAKVTYTFDGTYGSVKTEAVTAGSLSLGTTTYTVDQGLGVVTKVARNGIATDVKYDGLGRVTKVFNPGDTSPSVKYTYAIHQHNGNQATVEPAIMLAETLRKDGASTFAYTGTWTFSDGLARPLQTQTPDTNNTTERVLVSTAYDAAGRVEFASAPTHNATNAAGNGYLPPSWNSVVSYTKSAYPTGRDVTQTAMSGATALWSSSVNNSGYDTVLTDANANITTQKRDHRGRLVSVTDAKSETTSYGYDGLDRLTSVNPPVPTGSAATAVSINYAGGSPWKTSMVDPDTGTWKYRYDVLGRLTAQEDDENGWLAFEYDALGRRTKVRTAGTGTNPTGGTDIATWAYQNTATAPDVGLPTTSVGQPGASDAITVTNTYDQATLEVASQTWVIAGAPHPSYTFGYSYRDSGAIETLTYPKGDNPSGEEVTTIYSDLEVPIGLESSTRGALASGATYTPWGAPSQLKVGTGAGQVTTDYTYDLDSLRLNTMTSATGAAGDILDYAYEWDDGGNLTRLADSGQGVSGVQYQCYGYDNLDRLTSAFTTNSSGCGSANGSGPDPFSSVWTYDEIGNIKSASGLGTVGGSYSYGSGRPHAVTTAGTNTYTYNDVGNMVDRNVAGQAAQTLGYDSQNRLVSITENNDTVAEFVRDANGTRIVRTVGEITTYSINELYEVAVDASQTGGGGPTNGAPVVSAGPDATIVLPAGVSLDGSVVDDGLPGGPVTTTWSQVSGPGTAVFANAAAIDTTATFPVDGTYVLQLLANDTEFQGTETVTVTVLPAGGGSGALQVLLVSATSGPHADDVEVKTRLEGAGHVVTVFDDDGITAAAANGKDLVLVSDTVGTSKVGNVFETTAVPVIFWKSWIYDDNELTPACGSGNCGTTSTNSTQVVIAAPTHPLAAGLTGTVTVASSSTKWSYGKPAASATVVATHPNDSSQAVLFGYETGAAMDGGLTAPERRVGLFFRKTTPGNANANGWALFDAAVDWAANASGGGGAGNAAPVVAAGNEQTITLPATASLDGTVTDDGLAPGGAVTQTWTATPNTGVSFANASAVDTTVTFTDAGIYLLQLEATDGDLTASDTVIVTVQPVGGGASRVTSGLQVLYEFDETSGTTVADTSGVAPALDLTIGTPANTAWGTGTLDVTGPTLINSGTAASKVNNAVVASGEITVEAWIAPDNTTQNGPARIVTISDSTTTRNMTLGQGVFNNGGNRIEARLRTTGTGTNGTPATQTAVGTLDMSLQHVVFTRTAAGVTTVYIDGVAQTTGTASGDMTGWDATMQLALAAELDGTRTWEGEYNLVAIYNQALSQAEVTQNFGAGPNPTTGSGGGGGGSGGGGSGPAVAYTSYYSFAGTTIGYANQTGFTAIAAGHLGSTEATINPTGVAQRQTYTPFGATRSSTSNLLSTDRTYTGQTDDQTGLLHYRARQYDPQLGRFVQADTIIPGAGDLQNFNRYSYVNNRPLVLTDPSGNCPGGNVLCFEYDEAERQGLGSLRGSLAVGLGERARRGVAEAWASGRSEMDGQLVFQNWLSGSGRLGDAGSDWWKRVNGELILDMQEAASIFDGGKYQLPASPAVEAWLAYARGVSLGVGGSAAQGLYWVAHQLSLHAGIDAATGLLAAESASERDFISLVVDNVDLTAINNIPTDGIFADGMNVFLWLAYPGRYPARAGDGIPMEVVLTEDLAAATYLRAAGVIGLASTVDWGDLASLQQSFGSS